jgi:hypothetical protein
MRRSTRAAAALAGVTLAVTGVTATNAAAHNKSAPRFGFTTIRKGVPDSAGHFTVTSPDVRDNGAFPASAWADSFGCTGPNQQIRLSWSGAPKSTRSYAVTMFDPDAPSGAGFWHWLTWDIPPAVTTLGPTPPPTAVSGTDDAGVTGYLGPCPPSGDIPHHYEITVYALNTTSLALAPTTPATVTAFTMSAHILATARLTAIAAR